LKGPEAQESIERSAFLTKSGCRDELAPGSKALKPHDSGRAPPAARRTCRSEGNRPEDRMEPVKGKRAQGAERRHGSGRGKSSVGPGTPGAHWHETRPGRLVEEEPVERVRNPVDGTYRERQTRARVSSNRSRGGLDSLDSAEGAKNLMRGVARHAKQSCATAHDGHTLKETQLCGWTARAPRRAHAPGCSGRPRGTAPQFDGIAYDATCEEGIGKPIGRYQHPGRTSRESVTP
jgi:hypothetical protein